MRDSTGTRIARWERRAHPRKVCQYAPLRKEVWLRVLRPPRWYLMVWLPRSGWHLASSGLTGSSYDEADYREPIDEIRMKRRTPPAAGTGTIVPALAATSTMLNKLPLVREHLSATQYEDGTPRLPGYLTLRNRVTSYEVTLYDPDSGTRLACHGPDIDRTLLQLETMIGVAETVWELDQYLMDQLERRKKSKKR